MVVLLAQEGRGVKLLLPLYFPSLMMTVRYFPGPAKMIGIEKMKPRYPTPPSGQSA
jgi:hypothetical protein